MRHPMAASSEPLKEGIHKTKLIQFFDLTTQIILQNNNGSCPLLAICNVLLLKNIFSLGPEIREVSQDQLLNRVADQLYSNSDLSNKDAAYVENQQQKICDAFELLPRLTTGIDVNIKFKEVTDFELTRECAIFHLLDIPLYHGWIIDPQDSDTYNAIGSKSYNTIMEDLVGLETAIVGSEYTKKPEEKYVGVVAATTGTLGLPSSSFSRCLSSEDSTGFGLKQQKPQKGDLEEEAQLLMALKMSEAEFQTSSEHNSGDSSIEPNISVSANESSKLEKSEPVVPTEISKGNICDEIQKSCQHEPSISNDGNDFGKENLDLLTSDVIWENDDCLSSKNDQMIPNSQLSCKQSGELSIKNDVGEKTSYDLLDFREATISDSCEADPVCGVASGTDDSGGAKQVQDQSMLKPNIQQEENNQSAMETSKIASDTVGTELDPTGCGSGNTDVSETVTPSGDGTEPIFYEGEECFMELGATLHEDREPEYEGEVVLAEEMDKNTENASDVACKNGLSPEQGELIKDFLKTNASQLTVFGLISLQEKLNDRELCVLFRNNHFNTMFKYEGQLYLLATDQGYINQPGLVWEKLNEVNGNTEFMTGTFKEFKVKEDHAQDFSTYDSDLQLAMALHQEYEQPQRNSQQRNVGGGSRFFRGPQAKLIFD